MQPKGDAEGLVSQHMGLEINCPKVTDAKQA